MRKIHWAILSCLLFCAAVFFNSCEEHEGGCGDTLISTSQSDESHNAGQNCMNCHKASAEGEGCFNLAGTVYNTNGSAVYPGATVKLYTAANGGGELVASLQADSKGNFYSTENINFGTGLFPVIENTGGNKVFMPSSVTTGSCNSCHGVTTSTLRVN